MAKHVQNSDLNPRFRLRRCAFDLNLDYAAINQPIVPLEGSRDAARLIRKVEMHRTAHIRRANEIVDRIPGPGEMLHGITTGNFDFWNIVPAMQARINHPIALLLVATLSYNRANGVNLCAMVDAGLIKACAFIVSCYFVHTSRPIYDALKREFARRQNCRINATRCHAKILGLQFESGPSLVIEGSANLRKNPNQEQFTMADSAEVFGFHRAWIEAELAKPEQNVK